MKFYHPHYAGDDQQYLRVLGDLSDEVRAILMTGYDPISVGKTPLGEKDYLFCLGTNTKLNDAVVSSLRSRGMEFMDTVHELLQHLVPTGHHINEARYRRSVVAADSFAAVHGIPPAVGTMNMIQDHIADWWTRCNSADEWTIPRWVLRSDTVAVSRHPDAVVAHSIGMILQDTFDLKPQYAEDHFTTWEDTEGGSISYSDLAPVLIGAGYVETLSSSWVTSEHKVR